MKQYIVDAFAEALFTGNPAAVLPCREMPSPALMQQLTLENNYSETAFVVKRGPGAYDLKWYTPGGEIDLCGHATLATAFVLHEFADKGVQELHFHTLSGELVVTVGAEGYTLDFPVGKTKPIPLTEEIVLASDGLAREAYFDGGDLVAVVPSVQALRDFVPDAARIQKTPGLGLVLTAAGEDRQTDFVSRCFYPKLNVLEDPVTGRAHTYLAPIWAEKQQKTTLLARQLSSRGGAMTVRLAGSRVFLTGRVQLFMQGDIPFDL